MLCYWSLHCKYSGVSHFADIVFFCNVLLVFKITRQLHAILLITFLLLWYHASFSFCLTWRKYGTHSYILLGCADPHPLIFNANRIYNIVNNGNINTQPAFLQFYVLARRTYKLYQLLQLLDGQTLYCSYSYTHHPRHLYSQIPNWQIYRALDRHLIFHIFTYIIIDIWTFRHYIHLTLHYTVLDRRTLRTSNSLLHIYWPDRHLIYHTFTHIIQDTWTARLLFSLFFHYS